MARTGSIKGDRPIGSLRPRSLTPPQPNAPQRSSDRRKRVTKPPSDAPIISKKRKILRPTPLAEQYPTLKPYTHRRVDLTLAPLESEQIRQPARATIWDILAGRVNYEGFIRPAYVNEHGEVRIRSKRPQSVQQVLARRRRMPMGWDKWVEDVDALEKCAATERQEEQEQDKEAVDKGPLMEKTRYGKVMPDSGIMMALHTVAADHYWAEGQEEIMNMAFDESALMCAAILLEEQGKEIVGEQGYRVLEEAEDLFGEGLDDNSDLFQNSQEQDEAESEGQGAVVFG